MSMLKLSALPLAAFMGAAIWGAAAMVPFAPGPDEDGELAAELTDVREKLVQERARVDRLKRLRETGPKLVR